VGHVGFESVVEFVVVLLVLLEPVELFPDEGHHFGYFFVLVSVELHSDFFVAVVAGVKVYETFERHIGFVVVAEFLLCGFSLPHICEILDHLFHDVGGVVAQEGVVDGLDIFFVLCLVGGCEILDSAVFVYAQDGLLELVLIVVDVGRP
jgi:hypothetical protein